MKISDFKSQTINEEWYDVYRDYKGMGYSDAEARAEANRRYPDEAPQRPARVQQKPELAYYMFYDIPKDREQEALAMGVKKLKSGKFAIPVYNTSGRSTQIRITNANTAFGAGKQWAPKKTSEAEEPKADTSARAKLDHSLRAQGHKVEKDRKKAAKRGEVKHKGRPLDEGPLVLSRPSDLPRILDSILDGWKSGDHTDEEYAELFKALGYKMDKKGDRTVLVKEAFKNTYDVGDRVDGPLGTGTIVAVSKNVNVDGKVKVKLDDPSKAGADGEHKDSFVLRTTDLQHINELEEAVTAKVYKTNGKYWVVDVKSSKIDYTDWGPRGDGFASKEDAEAFAKKVTKEGLDEGTDFRKGDSVKHARTGEKGTVLHKGNRDEVVVKFGSLNKSLPASELRLVDELDEAPGAIRKGLAAVALIAGLWGVNNQMAQQAYDASPQLQKLTAYLEVAKQHNDKRMIDQLEARIEAHKFRIDLGKGEVVGQDGRPIDVVYDKEMDEAHPNNKIYDKCWKGYKKVPGKKRGEPGSCVKK